MAAKYKGQKVGVLMGGLSAEREISLKTGQAILAALLRRKINAVGVDVDRNLSKIIKENKIEIAFLALHGPLGEDGTVQGLLDVEDLPYTGSGVLASALAMNKPMAKRIFAYHGIRTPQAWILEINVLSSQEQPFFYPLEMARSPYESKIIQLPKEQIRELVSSNISILLDKMKKFTRFPIVIKPASQGSTVGILIVSQAEEEKFQAAILNALEYEKNIMVEEYIAGREITVGMLGSQPLPVVEIRPKSGFYDYLAKYTSGQSEYLVPAPIEESVRKEVQQLGYRAFLALGCEGPGRVDFRLTPDGMPYVLEVNTMPGMTEMSLLPMAAKEYGLSFEDLVLKILDLALQKYFVN